MVEETWGILQMMCFKKELDDPEGTAGNDLLDLY